MLQAQRLTYDFSPKIWRVVLLHSFLRQSSFVSTDVISALEVLKNDVRDVLLTY